MVLFLSILLLLFGAAGASLAFFGETLKKEESSFKKRVTKLGWYSVALLFSSMIAGIAKEYFAHSGNVAAIDKQEHLYNKLSTESAKAEATLRAQIDVLMAKLAAANNLITLVPKEIDHPYFDSNRHDSSPVVDIDGNPTKGQAPSFRKHQIVSYNDHKPLKVYAGQLLKYQSISNPVKDVGIVIGSRRYATEGHGEIRIIGKAYEPIDVYVLAPSNALAEFKMTLIDSGSLPPEKAAELQRLLSSP